MALPIQVKAAILHVCMEELFNFTLKLYYKKERDQVDISFRLSSCYVQTFYFPRHEFEQILKELLDGREYLRPGLLVFRKKNFLRWSFDAPGMTHQIRVERSKWDELISDYQKKMDDDGQELITCAVL